MAYCVAGNYTIQNCLGIGIDPANFALDVVGVGTTANTGGVIGVFRSIENAARLYIVDEDGGANAEKPGGILSTTGYGLGLYSNSPSAAIKFYAGGCAAANEVMRICSNGNVGIGTTSMDTKLHVYNGSAGTISSYESTGITIENNNRASLQFLSPVANDAYVFFGNPNAANAGYVGYENTANRLIARSSGYVSLVDGTGEIVRITGGNVGIGTTSPTPHNGIGLVVSGTGADKRGIIELWDGTSGKSVFQNVGGDTYIGQLCKGTGAGDVYLLTGGTGTSATVSMTIKCAGNVGINTTAPDTRLHIRNCVNGGTNNYLLTIQNTCTVSDARAGIAFLDNENTVGSGGISGASIQVSNNGVDGAGNLLFSTLLTGTTTERMRITSAGNVGIGTTSPTINGGGLEIAGGSQRGLRVSSTSGYKIEIGADTSWGYIQTLTAGQSMAFYGGAAQGPYMLINCAGNVGIGTTSPSTILNVASSAPTIRLNPTTQNNVTTIEFGVLNAGTTAYAKIDATNTINYDSNLRFFTNGVGSLTQVERMRIDYSGNVGIGCSLPRNKVEVIGSTSSPDLCTASCDLLKVAGSGNSALNVGSTVVSPYGMWMQVKHQNLDNLTYPLIFQPCGGNAGIGIMNPTYKLHVNGTFYAAGSSIKYKEGICNYDTDSCLFMCLKPVTYQYKDEFKHLGKELKSDIQIGLIAEDVAEVMPELAVLVNEEDEKVVRNVDYEKLSIVLLAEVQKLRREVDTLKNN